MRIEARSSLHPIHSQTDGIEGFVELDGRDGRLVGGQLTLPVKRLRSGNPLEDAEMFRRIDARRFPTIDGVLTDVLSVGENGKHRLRGEVTFRGQTRTCEGEVVVVTTADDYTVMVEGRATFDIRDFGMQPPRILMLRVDPEVEVQIAISAEISR